MNITNKSQLLKQIERIKNNICSLPDYKTQLSTIEQDILLDEIKTLYFLVKNSAKSEEPSIIITPTQLEQLRKDIIKELNGKNLEKEEKIEVINLTEGCNDNKKNENNRIDIEFAPHVEMNMPLYSEGLVEIYEEKEENSKNNIIENNVKIEEVEKEEVKVEEVRPEEKVELVNLEEKVEEIKVEEKIEQIIAEEKKEEINIEEKIEQIFVKEKIDIKPDFNGNIIENQQNISEKESHKSDHKNFDLFTTTSPVTTSSHSVIDKFENKKSLNDLIAQENKTTIIDKAQNSNIKDIKSLIGINEKFLFINELFEGNLDEYNNTINYICNNDDAIQIKNLLNSLQEKYKWNEESDAFIRLKDIVGKKL